MNGGAGSPSWQHDRTGADGYACATLHEAVACQRSRMRQRRWPRGDHAVEQMTRLATLPSSSTRTWRRGELLCALTKRHPTGWAGRAHRISEQAMQRHRATFRSDWIACSDCLVGNMCWKPSGSCRQPLDPRRQIAQRAMRLFQFVVGLQAQPEALSRS
ncbi:hypothetical protein NX08_022470 [Xanthomonas vasicola]|nr:hypothetical protein NX08_022470 [Xanthomonas vasicola]